MILSEQNPRNRRLATYIYSNQIIHTRTMLPCRRRIRRRLVAVHEIRQPNRIPFRRIQIILVPSLLRAFFQKFSHRVLSPTNRMQQPIESVKLLISIAIEMRFRPLKILGHILEQKPLAPRSFSDQLAVHNTWTHPIPDIYTAQPGKKAASEIRDHVVIKMRLRRGGVVDDQAFGYQAEPGAGVGDVVDFGVVDSVGAGFEESYAGGGKVLGEAGGDYDAGGAAAGDNVAECGGHDCMLE
jgi:hypothetical protein